MVPKANRQVLLSRTQELAEKQEEMKQTATKAVETVLKERETTKNMAMEIQARTQTLEVRAIMATPIQAAGMVIGTVTDLINQNIRSRNRRRLSCWALAYSLSEPVEL